MNQNDIAVVIGAAENVLLEYESIKKSLGQRSFDLFLVNDMISTFPDHAQHAATMHPRKLNGWLNQRKYQKFRPIDQIWINRFYPNVNAKVSLCWGGSSGLFATKVAVEDMHYKKIILCGIPMDADAKHFLRKKDWSVCNHYRPAWEEMEKMGKLKNVRSMSGWTKDLLGFPELQWINE